MSTAARNYQRTSTPMATCPWCETFLVYIGNEELKQHMRQHLYQDFKDDKISKMEVRTATQKKLLSYLETKLF